MIEGLKLKITSEELKDHCGQRSNYHRQRAHEKENQLPALREALLQIKNAGSPLQPTRVSQTGKGGYHLDTDDPVEKLESDIKEHRNKSQVFAFFARHLFDEDYTLQEADLVRLEVLKR